MHEYIMLGNGVCPETMGTDKSCDYVSIIKETLDKSLGKRSRENILKTAYESCKGSRKCVATEAFNAFEEASKSEKTTSKLMGIGKNDLPEICIYQKDE